MEKEDFKMFKNTFGATVQLVVPKRLKEEKSGDLVTDITISCVITEEMAADLGGKVQSFIDAGSNSDLLSLNIRCVIETLVLDIWLSQDDLGTGPYLSLTAVKMKKYKLTRDEDTGAVLLTVRLKTSPLSEADLVRVIQCIGKVVVARMEAAQGELPGVDGQGDGQVGDQE